MFLESCFFYDVFMEFYYTVIVTLVLFSFQTYVFGSEQRHVFFDLSGRDPGSVGWW